MQYVVKHRTASGDLEQGWIYLPNEHRVLVSLKRGSLIVEFTVSICSDERPRMGAHPLQRASGDTWRVLRLRYWAAFRNGLESLEPCKCPVSEELDPGDGLLLTNTPHDVTRQLEAL